MGCFYLTTPRPATASTRACLHEDLHLEDLNLEFAACSAKLCSSTAHKAGPRQPRAGSAHFGLDAGSALISFALEACSCSLLSVAPSSVRPWLQGCRHCNRTDTPFTLMVHLPVSAATRVPALELNRYPFAPSWFMLSTGLPRYRPFLELWLRALLRASLHARLPRLVVSCSSSRPSRPSYELQLGPEQVTISHPAEL